MEINWPSILKNEREGVDNTSALSNLRKIIETSRKHASIAFGTSGWRAEMGEDYSFYNVQRVTQAIVDLVKNDLPALAGPLGVAHFSEFQERGVLLGHDTRFMGPEFSRAVAAVLTHNGVKVKYSGVASTPEFSAAVPMEKFACSINLTPSHNPGKYGGYKFNPADGGPAGQEITSRIEYWLENPAAGTFEPVPLAEAQWDNYDILSAYIRFITERSFVDIHFIRAFAKSGKITLAHDAVYGATRGRPYAILEAPDSLKRFRDEEEPLFKGLAPEPSGSNMKELCAFLDGASTPLKLGVIMDPDGDRVRFYDGDSDMAMNQFGAVAFHYMVTSKGLEGGVAKSVATSNLINAVAAKLNRPLYETAVGFKNFREYLQKDTSQRALICFEESDGISGFGNTLEKDAQIGFLLALEIMGKTEKSLTQYLREIEDEVGRYFPERHGFELEKGAPPVGPVMERLKNQFKPGESIHISGRQAVMKEIITLDGLKIIFEDASWMLIRPSGTEPKVRVYTESQNEKDSQAIFEAARDIFLTAMQK